MGVEVKTVHENAKQAMDKGMNVRMKEKGKNKHTMVMVCLDATLCYPVNRHQHFGEIRFLHVVTELS